MSNVQNKKCCFFKNIKIIFFFQPKKGQFAGVIKVNRDLNLRRGSSRQTIISFRLSVFRYNNNRWYKSLKNESESEVGAGFIFFLLVFFSVLLSRSGNNSCLSAPSSAIRFTAQKPFLQQIFCSLFFLILFFVFPFL